MNADTMGVGSMSLLAAGGFAVATGAAADRSRGWTEVANGIDSFVAEAQATGDTAAARAHQVALKRTNVRSNLMWGVSSASLALTLATAIVGVGLLGFGAFQPPKS